MSKLGFARHLKNLKSGERPFYDNGFNGSVYMLCMTLPNGQRTHYVGYSKSSPPTRRIQQHLAGRGAQETKRYLKMGAKIEVAYVWEHVHAAFELFLHGLKSYAAYCPICGLNRWPIPQPSDMSALCFDPYAAGQELYKKRILKKG